jgi:N-sulfoglucosamine sulfohydrolase
MKPSSPVLPRRKLLAAAGLAPAILRADRRPNILWILGDDLGPQLSCYGHPLVRTPNMDRLANEGVRFTRAHTTAPVCSSSRSAFNIGLYQTFTGTHDHRSHRDDGYQLPHGARLVSQRLAEAGYFTANVLDIAPGVRGTGKTDWNWAAPKGFEGKHWRERAAGQPFYAQINFQAPHKGPAFKAARKQKTLIDPARVDLPPYYPDHPIIRDEVANYYDAIQLLDMQVGATLDALKADGVLDNTIIFLFGDNGRCLLRGKQWLYDGGTHIPLLARYPGVVPAGQRRDDPVLSLDITAQTLTWAGLPLPKPFHGQNLFGTKARSHIFTARDRCDMTVDRIRAVQDQRFKLIHNLMPEKPYTQHNTYIETEYPTLGVLKQLHAAGKLNSTQSLFLAERKPEWEFFDLLADPHETRNLYQAAKATGSQRSLQQRLDQWVGAEPVF